MRNAMILAFGAGLAVMVACSRGDVDIDLADGDTGAEAEVEYGDLSVMYVLIDGESVSCEDAGVSIVHVIAAGPEDPIEVDYPCDGEEIRLASVPVGIYSVSLRGESADGPVYAGSSDAEVTVEGVAIDVELTVQ